MVFGFFSSLLKTCYDYSITCSFISKLIFVQSYLPGKKFGIYYRETPFVMGFLFISWPEWVLANNVAFSDENHLVFTEQ